MQKNIPVITTDKLGELISNPDYLLFDINQPGQLLYAHIDEKTYLESAFLDERISPRPTELVIAKTRPMLDALKANIAPDIIIAHTSFCCSTLLSRLLIQNDAFVLSEPRVFTQFSNQIRLSDDKRQAPQLKFADLIQLFNKKYLRYRSWGIKFSNFSNNLIIPFINTYPESQLLLMWGDLESFLVSMLKHSEEAKKILPIYHRAFSIDYAHVLNGVAVKDDLSMLEMAGLIWWLQINQFTELVKQYDLRTLKGNNLLDNPNKVLLHLSKHIKINTENLGSISVDAPIKKKTDLHGDALKMQRQSIAEKYKDDIIKVELWLNQHGMLTDTSILEAASIIRGHE